MLKVLIVDDEPAARSRMVELLSGDRHIAVVGEVGSVFAAKEFIAKQVPDVIFLDIEMPNGSSFDLLSSVSDATQVVFVTAWDKYAVQAFAMAASDYLVKPVDPERLQDTLERHADGTLQSILLRRWIKIQHIVIQTLLAALTPSIRQERRLVVQSFKGVL